MLNASVGVQRVLGRLRRPPDRRPMSSQTSRAAADFVRRWILLIVAESRIGPTRERRSAASRDAQIGGNSLVGRLGHDRAVAFAVAGILLGASVVSVIAGRPMANTGGPTGDGPGPRIAIGGADGGPTESGGPTQLGSVEFGRPDPTRDPLQGQFETIVLGDDIVDRPAPVSVEGPFLDDGTLVKPVAVDTTVADGSDLVKTYKVQAGDTLVGIASKHGVSMMTVWWANDLKSKVDLKVGQVLRIPPVTGLIVQVTAQDTLPSLAARYDVTGTDILATNGLTDPNLVVGQILVVPGAKGKAIPVPVKPSAKPPTRSSGGGSTRAPASYTGGKFMWPVVGGGNYISQYFHSGHYGLDIAADYNSTVRAAASGTVIFAGWKSNGGGYQVWVAHGSGLYTTYNHMSGVSVGQGERVARGQQVGRIGESGNATGPHVHFEVWRGPIWDGGARVNPLGYL